MLLVKTADQSAEQVRAQRERFGTSYLTVVEPEVADFAAVIDKLC